MPPPHISVRQSQLLWVRKADDQVFLNWLAREGVVSATTCDTGFLTSETNPLLLPRLVDTTGRTDLEFESWLSGVGHFLSRRKRGRLAYVPD